MTPQQKSFVSESKKLYQSLQGKTVFCPILAEEVSFTGLGWQHLAHKKSGRKFADIFRRIKLLTYVEGVIKNSISFQQSRVMSECYILYGVGRKLERGRFVKVRVGVNLVRDKQGRLVFFSVF